MASPTLFTALVKELRKISAAKGQPQPLISRKVSVTLDNVTSGRLDATDVAQTIGIGVQGLADAFILMRMPFDSDEARQFK